MNTQNIDNTSTRDYEIAHARNSYHFMEPCDSVVLDFVLFTVNNVAAEFE